MVSTLGQLLVVLAIMHCTAGLTKEDRAKALAAREKCKKEHEISDESMGQWMNSLKIPEGESGKCYVACYMNEVGYMVNGKLNLTNVLNSNKQKWSDKATLDSINNIDITCHHELEKATGSACAIAAEYVHCKLREIKRVGLKYPTRPPKSKP